MLTFNLETKPYTYKTSKVCEAELSTFTSWDSAVAANHLKKTLVPLFIQMN